MLTSPVSSNMVVFLLYCISSMLLISACDSDNNNGMDFEQAPESDFTLTFGNRTRSYQRFIPTTYVPNQPTPVILAFHGQTSSARDMQASTRLDKEAERLGMIVVYPDDAVGDWAEGCNCSRADAAGIDDVGFTRALIDTLRSEFTIDADRIYAVGFSIGGLFVQRLACEMSSTLAGVATISATMSVPLSRTCQPESPLSMMVMLGTRDPVFPFEGLQNAQLSTLSAQNLIAFWRTHNACTDTAETSRQTFTENLSVEQQRFADCQNAEVRLYTVEGGIHAWYTGVFNTSEIITNFFAAQAAELKAKT